MNYKAFTRGFIAGTLVVISYWVMSCAHELHRIADYQQVQASPPKSK